MKWILAALLLVGTAFAQIACPVNIEKMRFHPHPYGYALPNTAITYKNVSDKVIVGVKFKVTYIDDTGDEHTGYGTFTSDAKLKPGKSKFAVWDDLRGYSKGRGEVMKVLFEDGSTWEAP
jgi:hypothetical protein